MAATFEQLASTTLNKYASRVLRDNVFDSNALFFLLKERATGLDGGEFIREPLMHGKNSTAQSYSGYDVLDVSPQQGFANAEFNWKQYSVSVQISGADELKNMGEAQVIDLLRAKIMQAELSIRDVMNTDLFGDGTGNGGKALDGLAIAVDSAGTYGGINRASYPFWAANETAVGGPLQISHLNRLFNSCSKGGKDHPNLIISDQDEFEAYENLLQPDQRFSDNKMADAGFLSLTYKDQPWVWDEAATPGTIYMLNTNYLNLKFHKRRNFETTPFIRPANQDARVALILWMGNLTGSNCRRQGKLTGLTD